MASVYRKRNRWYIHYKDHTGRRRNRPTKARTKTEARRMADELERQAERIALGIEDAPAPFAEATVGYVLAWYLEMHLKGRPSHERTKQLVDKHLVPAFGDVPLAQLTRRQVETFLEGKSKTMAPQSVNHLRGFLVRSINLAIKQEKWAGANVARDTDARRVPRKVHDYLRLHEVAPTLLMVSSQWRPLFGVAVYTGLRKGELFGLRVEDVDLEDELIIVRRSHDRDLTKSENDRVVPLFDEAMPYLRAALASSKNDLVFPNPTGGRHRPDTKLSGVLRRAMARAELVEGWSHTCRRKGCDAPPVALEDPGLRRCEACGMKLWPKPVYRPIRFQDVRATTATLMRQAGVPDSVIANILGHSDAEVTRRHYARVSADYLREVAGQLRLAPQPPGADAMVAGENRGPVGANVVPSEGDGTNQPETMAGNPAESPADSWSGRLDSNQRPPAPEVCAGGPTPLAGSLNRLKSGTSGGGKAPPPWQPLVGIRRLSGAILVPPVEVVEGTARRMLTVREVARLLGVSTATVYAMVESGELAHVRVRNRIRVRAEDLPG